MILDGIVLIISILAFIRGWKKGLLWAVFSLVAVIIGIILSLKLSHTLADYLFKNNILTGQYTLLLSFIIIFLLVLFAFRSGVKLVETFLDKVFLGWVNNLTGGLLYTFFVLFIASTFFWLANKAGLLKDDLKKESISYSYIEPISPKAIELASGYLPLCKNLYHDVEELLSKATSKFDKNLN